MGEFGQARPVAADHERGRALGLCDLGEPLRHGMALDLGVGSAQLGRQLPVAGQVRGGAGQAVADLDVHDQQAGVVGPGQFGGPVDHRLTPARAGVAGDDQR